MVARRPHDCPTHPSVGHALGSACCRASSGGLATGHETAWFRLALYFLLRAHCNALLHLRLTVAHPFRRCSVSLSKPWHLSNGSIQNCAGQPNLSRPIELQFDPSHGGSQGFKSPHLHLTQPWSAAWRGASTGPGPLQVPLPGSKRAATANETANRYSIAAKGRSEADTYPTFRLRDGCSASIWSAPDGSSLLTLEASSIQTDPDGSTG